MIPLLVALALQASPAPPVPDRFSILVPVTDQPCVPRPAPDEPAPDEIVVCGDPLPAQTLPLPREAVSANPVPSNPDLTGMGALAAGPTPCAARSGGCQVGFGPPLAPIIAGAIDLVKRVTARKPDTSNRVPIPLDEPAPRPISR